MDRSRAGKFRIVPPCKWISLIGVFFALCWFATPRAAAQPSSLYLRLILVKDAATTKKVADLLAQGKSFADVASEHSTDPTKDRGGFLGRVALKDLTEQIRATVASLKVGGFTGPVRVQNGTAFFQRTTTAHYTDALRLMRAKKYREALAPLEKDLSLNPDRVHSLALKAYAHQRLNRTKDAEATYRRIVKRDPRNVLAYNNLGTLLDQAGKYTEAAKMFERAVALDSKQDVILHNLAWIYSARLGKPSKALSFIRKAIVLKPNAANYYAMLGEIYRKVGNRAEARKSIAKAANLEPSNSEFKRILAELGNASRPKRTAAKPASTPAALTGATKPKRPRLVTPRPKLAPRKKVASLSRPSPPPAVPSIKVVTRTGGAKTSRLVQRLLKRNGFPVALRYREAKRLNGIRIYYKRKSVGAARKIRDLIRPRPRLKRLTWKSRFDIIVFVGK